MKTLTIRQVKDAAHENLRVAAAACGKSMEEFIREIIHARFAPQRKTDLSQLRALQARVAAQTTPGEPSAVDMVLEDRKRDLDLDDEKWRRVHEPARTASPNARNEDAR